MAARHTATRLGRTRGWGQCPVGPCMLEKRRGLGEVMAGRRGRRGALQTHTGGWDGGYPKSSAGGLATPGFASWLCHVQAAESQALDRGLQIQGACVHAQLSGLGKLLKLCTLS